MPNSTIYNAFNSHSLGYFSFAVAPVMAAKSTCGIFKCCGPVEHGYGQHMYGKCEYG